MRFEDFVSEPDVQYQNLLEYLELPHHDCAISQFSDINLGGRMGDPTGVKRYHTTSKEFLGKWKATLANPWRKIWAHRYLRWIGSDRLAIMGYQMEDVQRELVKAPMTANWLLSDLARIGYGRFYRGARQMCLDGD